MQVEGRIAEAKIGLLVSKTESVSERTKGAEKASCGETVVQKGTFGESVFFSAPSRFPLKTLENLRMYRENVAVHFRVLDDRFSAPAPLAHPQ